jgi:carboxymethylenebutenolidase
MHASVITVRADGAMPVKVFQPAGASGSGVIVYMDAFGWRDELDSMCRRYADAGYWTFLPDLYYRRGQLRFRPVGAAGEALDPAMVAANAATTLEMTIADTGALMREAAQNHGVRRFGTVGYCMGARHALAAAASYPDEIKAAACLHGGRMVWDAPSSPHLYIPRTKARMYFGFAKDDETCPDAHQALIEQTIVESGVRAEVEHYAAAHGWTFPERYCYDPAAAERAWEKVLALFAAEVAVV